MSLHENQNLRDMHTLLHEMQSLNDLHVPDRCEGYAGKMWNGLMATATGNTDQASRLEHYFTTDLQSKKDLLAPVIMTNDADAKEIFEILLHDQTGKAFLMKKIFPAEVTAVPKKGK